MHFNKKDLCTIPNILTYIRILLVPVFVLVYINATNYIGHIWSLAVIAASAITDIFDGIIARRTGQITDLGKILDPIADKAMEFAILFCVVITYPLVVILIVIFGAKELISLAFSGYLFGHNKNIGGAKWYGKLCTVVLYAVLLVFVALPNVGKTLEIIMVAVSGAFMILAFVLYMSAYLRLLKELKQEQK